jgi:PAS domain S-box-containing protein
MAPKDPSQDQHLELEEVKRQLSESQRRYREFVENIPAGIYFSTPGKNGRLLMANKAFLKMFGFKNKKDANNIKLSDLYVDPKKRKHFSDQLMTEGNVTGFEVQMKRVDGKVIWCLVAARVMYNREGEPYFDCAIRDITDRKIAQEELKKSYEKLKELDKMKDEFMAVASHELRTPLTIIKGYASMILEDHGEEIGEEIRFQVENILRSSKRLISLTNDMLDTARLNWNTKFKSVKGEAVDIRKFIWYVAEVFEPIAKDQKIDLQIKLPKERLPLVIFQKNSLGRVFNNLVGNAIKYIGSGNKIIISACKKNDLVEIIVENNGPHIPKDQHQTIFEKFHTNNSKESSKTKKLEASTGLGLAICKELIENFGGAIWVESTKGKNTKFIFTLHSAKRKEAEEAAGEKIHSYRNFYNSSKFKFMNPKYQG